MAYMKAGMSLNFGHIAQLTTELAALERLKNIVFPGFLSPFYSYLFNTELATELAALERLKNIVFPGFLSPFYSYLFNTELA